jgi:nucleoside-diphosphate-sugar epimerase
MAPGHPQKPTTFFSDEWRSPTYVRDLVEACDAAVRRCDELPAAPPHARVFNVGSPARMSRVDMALAVARVSAVLCCAVLCCAGLGWAVLGRGVVCVFAPTRGC